MDEKVSIEDRQRKDRRIFLSLSLSWSMVNTAELLCT